MYPSDYGYATSGGSNTDRNTCLAKELYNWPNYYECYSENWLYDQSYQWTLTVSASSSNMVFRIISSGRVDADANAYGRGTIFPALYLFSNVRISGEMDLKIHRLNYQGIRIIRGILNQAFV